MESYTPWAGFLTCTHWVVFPSDPLFANFPTEQHQSLSWGEMHDPPTIPHVQAPHPDKWGDWGGFYLVLLSTDSLELLFLFLLWDTACEYHYKILICFLGLLVLRLRAGHSSLSGRLSASDVFEKGFVVSLHSVSKYLLGFLFWGCLIVVLHLICLISALDFYFLKGVCLLWITVLCCCLATWGVCAYIFPIYCQYTFTLNF